LSPAFVFTDDFPNLVTYAYVREKVMTMNVGLNRALSLKSFQFNEGNSAKNLFKGLDGVLFGCFFLFQYLAPFHRLVKIAILVK